MGQHKLQVFYLFLVAILALLCGCNTTQFLDKSKGEQYLSKNVIKIDESKGKIKNRSNLVSELSNLYLKRENRKFFGTPRQYHYFVSQDTFDKSKFGLAFSSWLGRRGELPIFVDSFSAAETVVAMEAYMKTRGYFFADVNYEIKSNKAMTKAVVTYNV